MIKRSPEFYKDDAKSSKQKKILTKAEAYQKASAFCAYQERTQQEVREKLQDLGVDKDPAEEIISKLIVENFLNEERFAKAFAGGKFRMKKWGRMKIIMELKARKVSEYCIKKGLKEIPDEDYLKTAKELIVEKAALVKEQNQYKKNYKIAGYLISKGYEPDLVWDLLREEF
jgi:regulatory protein